MSRSPVGNCLCVWCVGQALAASIKWEQGGVTYPQAEGERCWLIRRALVAHIFWCSSAFAECEGAAGAERDVCMGKVPFDDVPHVCDIVHRGWRWGQDGVDQDILRGIVTASPSVTMAHRTHEDSCGNIPMSALALAATLSNECVVGLIRSTPRRLPPAGGSRLSLLVALLCK